MTKAKTTYKEDFINKYSHMMPKEMVAMFYSRRFSLQEINNVEKLFKKAMDSDSWNKDRRMSERRK
jgi:hypothetical protein